MSKNRVKAGNSYVYIPRLFDANDPNVCRGIPIPPNTKVKVLNANLDIKGRFVVVTDKNGNVQSVSTNSLKPVRKGLAA